MESKIKGIYSLKRDAVKIIMHSLNVKPVKGSIRGVARATGHSKNKTCRWFDIEGTHSKRVTTYFFTNLNLKEVEVDEIRSYIKKAKTCN